MAQLLQQVHRSEIFYRSHRSGQGPAWLDCGVMSKPKPTQGYRQRVVKDRFVLIYLLRGSGTYTDGQGVSHRLVPGDLVPHVPGRMHSMVPDRDGQWVEFFVQLPAIFFKALSEMGHLPADDARRHPGLRHDLFLAIDDLMEAMREAREWDAPHILNQAHALLNQFYRSTPIAEAADSHREAIQAACDALSRVDARDVDLKALAEQHGLSYERLRKLFRQAVGLPPGEYRIRRRIDRARALIAERGLSNKAIAFKLNYPDAFTFSKQFKKYVGMSPSAFRRDL